MEQLGEIVKMGSVITSQGGVKKDKYLVLFPNTLLILSASTRLSAFIYEGKLPLSGLSFTESEANKTVFDITGAMIESIQCTCLTRQEAQEWISTLSSSVRSCRQSAGQLSSAKVSVSSIQPPIPQHKTGLAASPAPSRTPRTGLASRGQGQGIQGWKMTCLRPAPPTRSFFQQGEKRNTLRRKEVEQSSYEDDLQILRVIEAYCTSKQRQTITNSVMFESSIIPLSLADESGTLEDSFTSAASVAPSRTSRAAEDRVERLERDVVALTRRLEMEEKARRRLQEVIHLSGINLPLDINPDSSA